MQSIHKFSAKSADAAGDAAPASICETKSTYKRAALLAGNLAALFATLILSSDQRKFKPE